MRLGPQRPNRVSQRAGTRNGNAVDATTNTGITPYPGAPRARARTPFPRAHRSPFASSSKPTPLGASDGVAQPRLIGNAHDRVDAAFTLAPASSNNRATSASPDKHAPWSGVQCVSVSVALGSAPAFNNTETISARSEGDKWQPEVAQNNTFLPHLVLYVESPASVRASIQQHLDDIPPTEPHSGHQRRPRISTTLDVSAPASSKHKAVAASFA